jgi:hypothetical protein
MTCKHQYKLKPRHAYLYEICEPNDTLNVTIRCFQCGYEKTATIGVEDKGVWE